MPEPIDYSQIKEASSPIPDQSAKSEITAFNTGDYEQQAGLLDGSHALEYRKLFFQLARIGICILFSLFAGLAIVWAVNICLPTKNRWLCCEDLQTVERLLFSGILISVGGKYFSKYKLLGEKQGQK